MCVTVHRKKRKKKNTNRTIRKEVVDIFLWIRKKKWYSGHCNFQKFLSDLFDEKESIFIQVTAKALEDERKGP